MNKYLFLITILVFILAYIYYILYCSYEKYKLWNNIKINFDLKKFKNICGNEIVEIGEFTNNDEPNLYPKNTSKIKLKDWFNNDNSLLNENNIQTRLFFLKDSTHPISLYLIKWIYNIKHNLPKKLQNILNDKNIKIKFSLRISRNNWDYPNHFDLIDSFMIIISGNRNVIIDNNKHYLLRPNDILFFETGIYHHFYCNNKNQLNIVFCISYTKPINKKLKKLDDLFISKYPIQFDRVIKNIDFI